MAGFDEVVRARRAVRGFFPGRPVPRALLLEALELAQRSPSNCNVQPWRVTVVSGEALDRLRGRLTAALDGGDFGAPEDPIDTFLGEYRALQVACGAELYEQMGVERQDVAGRLRALRRNFEFFDAPHLAVVTMDQRFGLGVALDVGMWVQTFMLALTARGIMSCPQAALRQYPELVREELGMPRELRLLCGVSLGYEDPGVAANRTRCGREPLETNVRFVD